jgi:hypothetical protein
MQEQDQFDMGERPARPRAQTAATRAFAAFVVVAIAGGLAAAFYVWKIRQAPQDVPKPPPVAQATPGVAPQPNFGPPVRNPIEAIPRPADESPKPLPALGDSDAALRDALSALMSAATFEQLIYPDRIVRRIVATVDNLPRSTLSTDVRPLKPAPGALAVVGPEGARQIGLDNSQRYAPYVRALSAVDSKQLVGLYVHFYPLFQQAYRDLGYPNGYFNDRLVEALDNALAAPVVEGPVTLTQPKVLYEYADPGLQSLSAGQKILVRMGPENAAKVKAKLREIRGLVAAQKPAQ